ncbi:hypothetical protein DW2_03849 [Thioclava atlantica]|uniref:Uncharacterized protein n=1 Tax=Thioclava atlantica TaxID=1317124 RepID=A0A085U0B5_9RHOB|nr:hypothetical protein DW2_03849 [Thioclava atlantica]
MKIDAKRLNERAQGVVVKAVGSSVPGETIEVAHQVKWERAIDLLIIRGNCFSGVTKGDNHCSRQSFEKCDQSTELVFDRFLAVSDDEHLFRHNDGFASRDASLQ